MKKLSIANYQLPVACVKQSFTLIELLIVISIIGIIGAVSAPNLSRFLGGGYLTTTTDKIVRTLRKAQNYALSGKEDFAWGVHYESELLVLFRGDNYTARDPSFDEKFNISRMVEVTGLTNIYFQKLRGEPPETLTIITISVLNDQRTVTVNSEGMVDVQ